MSERSIQSMQAPLLSRLDGDFSNPPPPCPNPCIAIRTSVRALQGMQKEAIVHYAPTGAVWRMFCDEGPYLNGTDLAPYPLAFFSAGLAASYLSELHALAGAQGVYPAGIQFIQDQHYGMQGSAIRGTMAASAAPAQLTACEIPAGSNTEQISRMLSDSVAASPADTLLRTRLANTFSLTCNGSRIDLPNGHKTTAPACADPAPLFDRVQMAKHPMATTQMIQKLSTGDTVFGVPGGVGTSLAPEQKRPVHLRAMARMNDDGMKSIDVRLMQPIGSDFHFCSDNSRLAGGQERAPSGLAFLSAGIAFCFMTQLGRYAQIVKQHLHDYRVVQDTLFSVPGSVSGPAETWVQPVRTHVFIESDEAPEAARKLLQMGEQTCFVHAACRTANKTRVRPISQPQNEA